MHAMDGFSLIIVVLKWMIVHVFTMLHRSQNSAKLMYYVGCVSTLVLKKVTVNWLSLLLIAKHNYCCFWIMVMMMMSKEQHVLISEILINNDGDLLCYLYCPTDNSKLPTREETFTRFRFL